MEGGYWGEKKVNVGARTYYVVISSRTRWKEKRTLQFAIRKISSSYSDFSRYIVRRQPCGDTAISELPFQSNNEQRERFEFFPFI